MSRSQQVHLVDLITSVSFDVILIFQVCCWIMRRAAGRRIQFGMLPYPVKVECAVIFLPGMALNSDSLIFF